MVKLNIFRTPREFSDANREYLERKETENNLILGLTDAIEDKSREYSGLNLLSVTVNGKIKAVSFRNSPRAVIAGEQENSEAFRLITDYYIKNNIILYNVIGELKAAREFVKAINLRQIKKRELIVHQLEKTNNISLTAGRFERSVIENAEQLIKYRIEFDNETFGYVRLDHRDLELDTRNRIEKGTLYNMIAGGELVSIASIMRKTANSCVIGMVYTPEKYRGNGYATNTVLSLSNEILGRGFSKCVLYSDRSNPVSDRIYKRIGYKAFAEFEDIYFENAAAA